MLNSIFLTFKSCKRRDILQNLFKLIKLFKLEEIINIADIGASFIDTSIKDSINPLVYSDLVLKRLGHLYAFEGDERHIAKLKNLYSENATILKHYLSDGKNKKIYICKEMSGMTSLLKPDKGALSFFNGFNKIGEIVKEEIVETIKLDDIKNFQDIHFVKIDTQGSELEILKHGLSKLKECVAIQIEVSFINLYENQPSFGDVDVWMRSQGFVPHRFIDVKGWSIFPTIRKNNFRVPFNQLLEADFVYIKNPLKLNNFSTSQLKMLGIMADSFFDSPDLAVHLLRKLESIKEVDANAAEKYLNLSLSN